MSKEDFSKLITRQLQDLFKIKIKDDKVKLNFDEFSPVMSIEIGDLVRAKEVAKSLQNDGFDVRAILSPTVAKGTERLRICLHTFNTESEIEGLAGSLNKHL